MNRRIVLALGLLGASLVGTGCGDDAKNGAVRLTIRYSGFVPGCVRVRAEDAKAAANSDEQTLTAANTTFDGELVVAVFREKSWSRDLKLTVTAHEQSCTGAQVATQVATAAVTPGKVTETTTQLTATDADGDGWIAPANGGSDCADDAATRFPGATEVCNALDEDCDGEVDDGAPPIQTWLDGDGDGFGSGTPIPECTPSAGRVTQAGDCNDGNGQVFPDAPERCDAIDNNCNQQNNEGFDVNGVCDPAGACVAGHVECIADGGSTCVEEPPSWFADLDRDDVGRMDGGVAACEQPVGYVASAMDCDDGDPFTNASRPEICDLRDNNCNNVTDEGGACGTGDGGWLVRLIGTSADDFSTVSAADAGWWWIGGKETIGGGGSPDRADLVESRDGGWLDRTTSCVGFFQFTGVWAEQTSPTNTVAYAAGCVHNGTDDGCLDAGIAVVDSTGACVTARTYAGPARFKNLVVLPYETGSRVFAVASNSVVAELNPSTLEAFAATVLTGAFVNDIHGQSAASVYVAGETTATSADPRVFRRQQDGIAVSWVSEPGVEALGATLNGGLLGIWVVHPELVYAVGENGMVLKKEGGSWTPLPSPNGSATVTSVRAFGTSAVYVTSGSSVYRYNGASWQVYFTGTEPLRDIAGVRPDDLITVGDNAQVVYSP